MPRPGYRWIVLAAVLLSVMLWRPAVSQDNDEERIAALEQQVRVLGVKVISASGAVKRVGDLETRVAVLEASGPGTTMETGSLRLSGVVEFAGGAFRNVYLDDSGCYGIGDFADLVPNSVVELRDPSSGAVLASGFLSAGPPPPSVNGRTDLYPTCRMPFEITSVPVRDAYVFVMGNERRVAMRYDQLVAVNWSVVVTP